MCAQATDSTFAAKLRQNLAKNPHFGYDKRSNSTDFLVDHFAGDVVYSCSNFLDKNRDTLSSGAPAQLHVTGLHTADCRWQCGHAQFRGHGPGTTLHLGSKSAIQHSQAHDVRPAPADLTRIMCGSGHPLLAEIAVGIAAGQDKRGSQTVGFRFREQLQDLISRLDKCAPCPAVFRPPPSGGRHPWCRKASWRRFVAAARVQAAVSCTAAEGVVSPGIACVQLCQAAVRPRVPLPATQRRPSPAINWAAARRAGRSCTSCAASSPTACRWRPPSTRR